MDDGEEKTLEGGDGNGASYVDGLLFRNSLCMWGSVSLYVYTIMTSTLILLLKMLWEKYMFSVDACEKRWMTDSVCVQV